MILKFKLPMPEQYVCGNLTWEQTTEEEKNQLYDYFKMTYNFASKFPEGDGIAFSNKREISLDEATDKLIETLDFMNQMMSSDNDFIEVQGRQDSPLGLSLYKRMRSQ